MTVGHRDVRRPHDGHGRAAGRRRGRHSLRVLGILLLAGACARTREMGTPLPEDAVARIADGRTTEVEIREWFGPPAEEVATNGGKVLTYQYRKESGRFLPLPFLGAGGGVVSGRMLIVTLDQSGKVIRHTYIAGP